MMGPHRWALRHGVVVALLVGLCLGVGGAGASRLAQHATPPKIDLNATIKIGSPSQFPTLDPHKWAAATHIHSDVWDRLTQLDAKGRVIPMVATSWATSKDGSSITFKLRTDVKFHDGTPLDATAVKASIDRAINLPGSAVAPLLQDVGSVDAVNKSTVRINLKFGGAELPAVLATTAGAIINPKCIANNTSLDLPPPECSSGGLVLDHASPPFDWFLKKAPGTYWQPNTYRFAALEYHFIGNTQTAFNALQTGDIDQYQVLSEGIPQARALIKSGQFAGKVFASPGMNAFMMNPRQPPFDNILLRKAVQAALDTRAMAHDYYAANCVPSQQPQVPTSFAYDTGWNPNPYDPTKSRQYLQQAGMPDGFSFTLVTTPVSSVLALAQIAQDQLAKVGIKARIQVVPSVADPLERQGLAQLILNAWGTGPDPSFPATSLFNIPESRNAVALGSNVEKQLSTLRFHALDPRLTLENRGKVYQQIWKGVYDNALLVNVCLIGQIWLHNKKLLNADLPNGGTIVSYGTDHRYYAKTD
jgi:peptide/nickel transport system substrate-binding protein